MTSIALKKKIYLKLEATNKKSVLEDVYRLLELADFDDEPLVLSKEQIKKIKTAQEQYKKGFVKSHQEVNKEFERWFAK